MAYYEYLSDFNVFYCDGHVYRTPGRAESGHMWQHLQQCLSEVDDARTYSRWIKLNGGIFLISCPSPPPKAVHRLSFFAISFWCSFWSGLLVLKQPTSVLKDGHILLFARSVYSDLMLGVAGEQPPFFARGS